MKRGGGSAAHRLPAQNPKSSARSRNIVAWQLLEARRNSYNVKWRR